MKNLIHGLILATFLILFGSISIHAAEVDDKEQTYISVDSIAQRYGFTLDDITSQEASLDALEDSEASDLDIGAFCLTSGLVEACETTFASEKTLIGQGNKDMSIGVVVYTYDDVEDEAVTVFSSVKVLGASGTYNETIDLKPMSQQYVTIFVRSGQSVEYRTYKITTIEEETKNILENIELNFIKVEETMVEDSEEKADTEEKTETVDSFVNWFNVLQEIEF